MIPTRDKDILKHLRANARKPMVDIAKDTGIPVSTIFEKLKRNDQKVIKKFTTILDFPKLGYNIRKKILINTLEPERLINFLSDHENINSIYKADNGFNLILDCIFKQMDAFYDFKSQLQTQPYKDIKILDITEEVKREEFMN
tara:strand:+ start:3098 stop:3526 length:429 start_codon:yes stop_codon:yes gene_type:complete